MLNKCKFFDKHDLSFMAHTAITPKFEMRWVNFVNALPLCRVGERSYELHSEVVRQMAL